MACLITEDGEELFRISTAETTIGRGPSLQVTDTRVSRNHAIIKLEDGKVFIKPIHKNPTFICKSNDEKNLDVLKKDLWNQLFSGDTISLLPRDLKFTVRIGSIQNQNDFKNDTKGKDYIEGNFQSDDQYNNITMYESKDDSPNIITSPKKRTLPSWMANIGSSPKEKKKTMKTGIDSGTLKKKESVPCLDKSKKTMVESDECQTAKNSSDNAIIKTELSMVSDNKEVMNDINNEEDLSMNQGNSISFADAQLNISTSNSSNTANTSSNSNIPSSINCDAENDINSTKKDTILYCPYGSRCYRKNPLHFQEYSHNRADENKEKSEDDDRPECQYGTSCYRQNPQHKRDFKHTKDPELGSLQHQKEKRKTRPKRKKADPSKQKKGIIESDDDGEDNNYDFNDSFIDDESSDEDVTDDDDEDYVPDGVNDDNEEDIDELVSEAKDFVNDR